jgi:ribosome recycling factor
MAADVRVNTVASRVRVRDADALLTPEVTERLVRAVMERLEEERRAEEQRAADRSLDGARARLG